MAESVSVQSIDVGKSVGKIPFSEDVTSNGGKTITIPILTAKVASSFPQIALSYNSQTGNSLAGYGWSVSGLSSISVTNKNIYYDGVNAPVDLSNPSTSVFSLDGTRLVPNNNPSMSDYQYETAQGYFVVKKILNGNNIAYFEVLLPNGSKATYGFTNNTATQLTYPVTSIVDMKGYRIDFEYISSGNMYIISKISYGSKTTTHPAKIEFQYESRNDYATVYVSNIGISQDQLLKKIISYNNSQELRTYTLIHSLSRNVNQLTRLDCSTGTSSLNPLLFGYNSSIIGDDNIHNGLFGFLSEYFPNGNGLITNRGKFYKNNYADGMLCYPKFSTYGVISTRTGSQPAYLYGSSYSPDQDLLIVPRFDFYSSPITIKAESGFQLLNAVDVNGDGVDEIVKVNLDGVTPDHLQTKLKISVYTLTSDKINPPKILNVLVDGIVNSSNYFYSPIACSYYFGDFRGNGKVRLLIATHDTNPNDIRNESTFNLFDLDNGSLIHKEPGFTMSQSEEPYVLAFDVDGDGKTELCHATSIGFKVYNIYDQSFYLEDTYTSTSAIPLSDFNKNIKLGDLNGDGKLDILVPPTYSYEDTNYVEIPVWAPKNCFFCGGLEPITDINIPYCRHCGKDLETYYYNYISEPRCHECNSLLQDCNGNSNTSEEPIPVQNLCCPTHGSDLIAKVDYGYVDNGNRWACYLNTGKGFEYTTQGIANIEMGDKVTFYDVNKDGLLDFIQYHDSQLTLHLNKNGVIQNTSQGNPITISDNPDLLPANIVNYYGSSNLVYLMNGEVHTVSFSTDESKANLLTSMTDSYGNKHLNNYLDMTEAENYAQTTTSRSYPYASVVMPLNLLSQVKVNSADNLKSFVNNEYSYEGAVMNMEGLGFCGFESISTTDIIQNTKSIETKDPEMFGVTLTVSNPLKEYSYYYERNEESNKQANPRMNSIYETDKLANTNTSATYKYDAYNNPTEVSENIGTVLNTFTTQTYYNSVSTSRYLIGQPLTKTVTYTRDGAIWQNKEKMNYMDATRLPWSKTHYVGSTATNRKEIISWNYDNNSNVISEKSTPYYASDSTGVTCTYDVSGRYIASSTNALGQTTTFSDYDKYGNPRTISDYKGRVTKKVYDDWGNLTSSTTPDGIVETYHTEWGGLGLYTVTKTETGKPSTIVHYDALGREVRNGNQRFDGQWQFVDQTYDERGRLEKISLPFRGPSPALWNTYLYDQYNRPTSVTEASGKMTTWIYNGLSTTETKNNIATTKTTDASGTLVKVEDPGGTIEYSLRPDGQPSSITAPGNVVTSLGYDEFGRKTSITDPSAGKQTFRENYNYNCTKTQTVTDANGKTITTLYDRYGRVTDIVGPEFSTTFVYNSDGLLSGETSTNGTSTSFTYDSFDRVATSRKNVPDGKYLSKTFIYGNGVLSDVEYTSQNGNIGMENYLYSNGYNTETKLNGSTSIWKLTEENDYGQPTKAVTGALERTYGYNKYGMPTSRTAGNIQNFAYDFDPQTGNLNSRTDNTRNLTETFRYDNLNRLSQVGTQQILYAANGNITNMPNIGDLKYENTTKPYQVTMLSPMGTSVPMREQQVTYTSVQRPNSIIENNITASFVYDADGERVKMTMMQGTTPLLTRYYLDNYEIDVEKNMERLYIDGDAYSAPAVYVKENGSWKLYYICRDYLGSITHIANGDGTLKQELSYDAWGRQRNLNTQVVYELGKEPELFLGRGYTGHEHLAQFGLINMNARLYDAALGRFLSPDPYVQMPGFTQSFNRYSYCLNNPFSYVDENGEFVFTIICACVPCLWELIPAAIYVDGALWGAATNVASNWKDIKENGNMNWGKFWSYAGLGAANGLGAASGNMWIFGATGFLQGAGNKFIEHDYKFDSDQILYEGLYYGLTNLGTSALLSSVKIPTNKPLGTKGLGIGDKIVKGFNKLGIEGNAAKYLGHGIANFSTSFVTNVGYYGFVTDNKEEKKNWLQLSLKMSALSTTAQFGLEYSLNISLEYTVSNGIKNPKFIFDSDLQINNYYSYPQQQLPSNHYQYIPQPTIPTYQPPTYYPVFQNVKK